jgi:hypothetical protein
VGARQGDGLERSGDEGRAGASFAVRKTAAGKG